MSTSPILIEKWRVQEQLAKRANYDVAKYFEITNDSVLALQKRTGLKLKYSKRKGGYLKISQTK